MIEKSSDVFFTDRMSAFQNGNLFYLSTFDSLHPHSPVICGMGPFKQYVTFFLEPLPPVSFGYIRTDIPLCSDVTLSISPQKKLFNGF